MKRLLLIAALLVSSAASLRPSAEADQNAPVLDELFTVLNGELKAAAAAAVTQEIWAMWLQHADARVNALMDAGMAAMRASEWRAAIARFDAAIERAPNFAEAWNKRATAHYMRGDFTASAADVVETLRLEPRHFGALSGQGMMHMQAQNNHLALIYFRLALAANPHMDNVRRYIELLSRGLDADPI